jgi:hypothetical protein
LPIAAAHSIAVGLVLLAPVVPFVLLARRDGLPLVVPLLALVLQVVIPGGRYGGGYTELVQWGLVTNVGAAVALFYAFAWSLAWVEDGSLAALAGAGLAGGLSLVTNPRSFLAFGASGIGILLARGIRRGMGNGEREGSSWRAIVGRLAAAGGLMALLAAPELMALARFSHLYTFVQYSGYAGPGDFVRAAAESVRWPVVLLGVAGGAAAVGDRRLGAARAAFATALVYAAGTLLFTDASPVRGLVPQLEATRLMPFQRLLTVYLAAAAVWLGSAALVRHILLKPALAEWAVAAVALAVLLWQLRPGLNGVPDPVDPTPPDRGLYPIARTAVPQQASLEAAVRAADAAAPPGTAILVLESALSWHEQLWSPLWTRRPLFFNDWLWYWQPNHSGTPGYRPELGNSYPDPLATLDPDYLSHHGIGGVVATGDAATAASFAPNLTPLVTGDYGAWLVRKPTTVVTLDGANAAVTFGDGSLEAAGTSGGGAALIRRNWFPRWTATVNGRPVPIERTADNYMTVPIPSGDVKIDLRYGVDPLDWAARALSLIGAAVAIAALGVAGRRALTRRQSAAAPQWPAGTLTGAPAGPSPPASDGHGR